MGMAIPQRFGCSPRTNDGATRRQFMSGLPPMRTRRRPWSLAGTIFLVALLAACQKEPPVTAGPAFEVVDADIADLQAALKEGRITSRELVERYLTRIQQYDARLKAIIAVNSHARDDADRLDQERAQGKVRGPLHGIPIVVKDNIDVAGIANTAGSLALVKNLPARDEPLVRRLTEAGAIILAKSNLSEWANIRS